MLSALEDNNSFFTIFFKQLEHSRSLLLIVAFYKFDEFRILLGLDPRHIASVLPSPLSDPIKAFGLYAIDVKLYAEITGKVNVSVSDK